MKLCIPTDSDRGLQARAYPHFGSAPWFTLLDTESGNCQVRANQNQHHAHGTCQPLRQLVDTNLDGIAVGGIGQRAWASLKAQGTSVYIVTGETVEGILAAARAGELKPIASRSLCHGHGEGRQRGRGHRPRPHTV